MAVDIVTILSTENKPTPGINQYLVEFDTGRKFRANKNQWVCILGTVWVSQVEPPTRGRQINDVWIQYE